MTLRFPSRVGVEGAVDAPTSCGSPARTTTTKKPPKRTPSTGLDYYSSRPATQRLRVVPVIAQITRARCAERQSGTARPLKVSVGAPYDGFALAMAPLFERDPCTDTQLFTNAQQPKTATWPSPRQASSD